MSDELFKALTQGKSSVPFRRKRKHKGETWGVPEAPTLQEVHRGEWCPRCRIRHPYNGSKQRRLLTAYETRGKLRVLMWLCPVSGDVLGERTWEATDVDKDSDSTDNKDDD